MSSATTTTVTSPLSPQNTLSNYRVLQLLGSGAFGTVYKIERKSDKKCLVWKEINYGVMSDKEKELLVTEVNVIKNLRSPFIVKYYDRIIDKDHKKIFIIMEYCSSGDLANFIKKNIKEGTFIEEEVIWQMVSQLSAALESCHNRREGRIIHRDIKPANIFMESNNHLKLGDFGLARILSEHSKFAHTNVGTPFYMSPEQISEAAYNEKSDIWSLGCVLYELCNLTPPFSATNHLQLAMKIRDGKFLPVQSRYSSELRTLIERMLTVKIEERLSIDDIVKHPQVSIRIREYKLSQHYRLLMRREAELKQKEMQLNAREKELSKRETEIKRMEKIVGVSVSTPKYQQNYLKDQTNMYKNFKIA